jgi:hypothetical protein
MDGASEGLRLWVMADRSTNVIPPGEYLRAGGDRARRRTAAFRLIGDRLDPATITEATGLAPKLAHRRGEAKPVPSGRAPAVWRSGLWLFDSAPQLSETENTLDEHLSWLLDQLEPHVATLLALARDQSLVADFFCGYFMTGRNRGFTLRPFTLARISQLEAELGIDVYIEGDAEEEIVIDEAGQSRPLPPDS